MTDISLLVDVRDDIISLTKSIKKITDDLSNADRKDEYWSLMERLAIEGTKYPYEVQSLVVEAITLTIIPLALLTYKAPSLSECYRRWENNPGFRDELEKLMPKTSKLARAVYHWSKKDSAVVKWWKMYQKSPSVLLHTPQEAERDFQAKKTISKCTETSLTLASFLNIRVEYPLLIYWCLGFFASSTIEASSVELVTLRAGHRSQTPSSTSTWTFIKVRSWNTLEGILVSSLWRLLRIDPNTEGSFCRGTKVDCPQWRSTTLPINSDNL
ncbi:hypothetical protein BJ165DRAFT_135612 [Panaeolus papilionaceus]|nr:hypothetical protein BJ165DRAFT_135612 [Panaeolus papilionaceus]